MKLTKTELRELRKARRALEGCLNYLWDGVGLRGERQHTYICYALNAWDWSGNQTTVARDLVSLSIKNDWNYSAWLRKKVGDEEFSTYTREMIQDGRRRLVLMLIEAIDRKLKQ